MSSDGANLLCFLFTLVLTDPVLVRGMFRIPYQNRSDDYRQQNHHKNLNGSEINLRTGYHNCMDHCHHHAKRCCDKHRECSCFPEQKQKTAKRSTENTYRESSGRPYGPAFDDYTVRFSFSLDVTEFSCKLGGTFRLLKQEDYELIKIDSAQQSVVIRRVIDEEKFTVESRTEAVGE